MISEVKMENSELFYLDDNEVKIMMALCNTAVKFRLNVMLGFFKKEYNNCIFKIKDEKWAISFQNNKVEVFDDIILACYKLIKVSVIPEILDFVINYFNTVLSHGVLDSEFLEFTNIRKKQRIKTVNKY
mgnify:CR=1 FL=1